MQTHPPKYIAQLKGVRELALHGTADLSWWRSRLAPEHLEPVEVDGHAQVIITALDASWMGVPFRDLSVAVVASRPASRRASADETGPGETGIFFASAFNASRFIVTFERYWFRLPYQFRADLHVDGRGAGTFRLGGEDAPELFAHFGRWASSEQTTPAEPTVLCLSLFLPNPGDLARRRWLKAKIEGDTSTYVFDSDRSDAPDHFTVNPNSGEPIFKALIDSDFRPTVWHQRESATHARTKTFRARH